MFLIFIPHIVGEVGGWGVVGGGWPGWGWGLKLRTTFPKRTLVAETLSRDVLHVARFRPRWHHSRTSYAQVCMCRPWSTDGALEGDLLVLVSAFLYALKSVLVTAWFPRASRVDCLLLVGIMGILNSGGVPPSVTNFDTIFVVLCCKLPTSIRKLRSAYPLPHRWIHVGRVSPKALTLVLQNVTN